MNAPILRLTALAHGGGCGCKLSPAVLRELLADAAGGGAVRQSPRRHRDRRRRGGLAPRRRDLDRRDHRLLHADGRRSVRLRPDRRDQRALRRLCDGGQADLRARGSRHADRQDADRHDPRDPARRARRRRRKRAFPVAGGHSIDSPEPIYGLAVVGLVSTEGAQAQLRGPAGRRADPHQAARRRHLFGGDQEGRALRTTAIARCSAS